MDVDLITYESIQPFLEWIRAHPTLAGFAVFLISLSESLAIVGLLVPGVVLMTAIGSMMGAGILPFYATLAWAILGAIAGDGISYWLGYHYHERLRLIWPFRQFPKLLARGERFFHNHGGKSIVFGRFVGPVRPMIPVIAGMLDMSPLRFLFFNVLSALAWAPLYSLPGILIGLSLGSLSPEVASRAGLLVLLLLFGLWCIYEFLLVLGSWIQRMLQATLDWSWRQGLSRIPYLLKACQTRQGSAQGQFGLLVLFVIAVATLIMITQHVLQDTGIAAWNEPVYHLLRALYNPAIIKSLFFLHNLGAPPVLMSLALIVGGYLILQSRTKAAACWFFSIGLGFILIHVLKEYTLIPRPERFEALSDTINQHSFPSAHTTSSILVIGLLATYLRAGIAAPYRWIPFWMAAILSLFVGFTRLYLGYHWFSDILGSLSLGIAMVCFGTLLFRFFVSQPLPLGILKIALLSWALCFALYNAIEYPGFKDQLGQAWPTYTLSPAQWWSGEGPTQDLYRSGALKKQATRFNVQWVGNITEIEVLLQQAGWIALPKLNVKSGVQLLATHPKPEVFPVMPKFHRDRLPMLSMSQQLNDQTRVVLQLWASDYFEGKHPLWVGTLRLEAVHHPFPMVTLYLEDQTTQAMLDLLIAHLKKGSKKISIRRLPASYASEDHQQTLLIRSR